MKPFASTCAHGALLFAIGFTVACSLIVNAQGEQQCTVDADCDGRGFPSSMCLHNLCVGRASVEAGLDRGGSDAGVDRWGCLADPPPPKQDTTVTDNVRVLRRFLDWTTGAPRALSGTVCGAIDATCGLADRSGTFEVSSDGTADVLVPRYFRGFLSLVGTLQSDADGGTMGRMPLLLPLFPVPSADDPSGSQTDPTRTVPLVDWEEWRSTMNDLLNLTTANLTASLSAGHILATVFDCTGKPTSDATLSLSQLAILPKTTAFYIDDATLLPSPARSATGANGGAGFVNAPAANLTLTVTHTGLNRMIATYTVPVQPGTLTYVAVWPNQP